MSYDLDQLHQKYGIQVASLHFSSATDLAGTGFIPGVSGQAAVIHQIAVQASAVASFVIERATGAASSYLFVFSPASFLPYTEQTRVMLDSGASGFLEAGAGCGTGVIKAWFTYQRSVGVNIAST